MVLKDDLPQNERSNKNHPEKMQACELTKEHNKPGCKI